MAGARWVECAVEFLDVKDCGYGVLGFVAFCLWGVLRFGVIYCNILNGWKTVRIDG